MPKEIHVTCNEPGCPNRASGIWRILKPDGTRDAAFLCANCGMYAYAKRRAVFSPGLKVRLFKTLGTKFVQADHKPQQGDKHWDEHKPVEHKRLASGLTAPQVLDLSAKKRGLTKSSVHPSILNQYRKD